MSRYHASFYHFLISLGVFFVLAYLILFQWYPDFFYAIDGGWEGMRIIIGVDLILGPCLTLIVFKTGKPGLKMDLTLIGTFQSICLLAGVFIVYTERPTYFIYYEKHFYSINQETFQEYGVEAPEPTQFNSGIPAQLYIKLPDNPMEEAGMRKVLYQDGVPPWLYKPLFEPLAVYIPEIIAEGYKYAELIERDRNDAIPAWLSKHGGVLEDYSFYPIHSRYLDAFLVIEKQELVFVGIIEIAPPMTSIDEDEPDLESQG